MRIRTLSSCALAISVCGGMLLLAPSPQALPLGPSLQLGAGASVPTHPSTVQDRWNTGFGLSAALMFKLPSMLSIGIETGFYRHSSDASAFEDMVLDMFPGVQFDGFDLWFVPVVGVAELNLLRWGVTKPFVRAGAGLYRTGTTDFSASGFASDQVSEELLGDFSQTAFGALIGVGVRTPLVPGFALSLDATYHIIVTDGDPTHFIPVRARIEF